ncbi:predicted protein [Botrytis cinerea T4]|uniref:Uncharacterized protein n=1 Tax=Botryotinia fuckeliana (strain T4) TaxID=999810 RepID=G2YQT3_BOTF4|nr:predicted protein [Botrytis cinerea T4]
MLIIPSKNGLLFLIHSFYNRLKSSNVIGGVETKLSKNHVNHVAFAAPTGYSCETALDTTTDNRQKPCSIPHNLEQIRIKKLEVSCIPTFRSNTAYTIFKTPDPTEPNNKNPQVSESSEKSKCAMVQRANKKQGLK